MQNATQIVTVAVVLVLILLLNHNNNKHVDALTDIIVRQRLDANTLLGAQNAGFATAVAAVSDATAKAVQAITYPEAVATTGFVNNDQLPSVREMPVRERDLSLDYTDPTDDTMPDVVLRPDAMMLSDAVNGPLGIPGFKVDPARYAGDEL